MIPTWLIAIGIGALVVVSYWDEIVDWIKDFAHKVFTEMKRRALKFAIRILAKKLHIPDAMTEEIIEIIDRVFYKEDGEWWQEDTVAKIDEHEVPQWAKAGVTSSETDVTQRYKRELQLTL